MRATALCTAGLLTGVALAVPAGAAAHSVVQMDGTTLRYLSSDITSKNTLEITRAGDFIRIDDPTADGGIDSGPCVPISTTRVECNADGVTRLYAEVGALDDTVKVSVELPTQILAGPGDDRVEGTPAADSIDGGDGKDELYGFAGDDVITGNEGDDRIYGAEGADNLRGGRGEDFIDGGAGTDVLRAIDSAPDSLICGEGDDKAEADSVDNVLPGCERIVDKATGAAEDTRRPVVRAGGSRNVRLRRGRTLRVYASTDEAGLLSARGTVRAGGRRWKLAALGSRVDVAGAGAALSVELPSRALRAVRSDLRRGRKVTARIEVYGVDAAGNKSRSVFRTVRIRR